jgi:hypothetical protein
MRKAQRCPGTPRLAGWQRLLPHRRPAWPDPLVLFRGDSHCASPAGRQWRAKPPALQDGTGVTRHAGLQALARAVGEQAQRADAASGRQVPRLHATRYQAQPWARARRVVSKVEGSAPGVTPGGGGTAREQARTHVLSQPRYGARGHAENASKEHNLSRKSARTACHRFEANQVRLLWHSAAYVWRETLRREV